MSQNTFVHRRAFLATGVAAAGLTSLSGAAAQAADAHETRIATPPAGKRILLSCKLGMISKKSEDRELTLVERLKMAGEAGFDGVDFDEAGQSTAQQARDAVQESGVFVHNAINNAHWKLFFS